MPWYLLITLFISGSLLVSICGIIQQILPLAPATPVVVVVTATPPPTTPATPTPRPPTATATPPPPTSTPTPSPTSTPTPWPTPPIWVPVPPPQQPPLDEWGYLPLVSMILEYYGEIYEPAYLRAQALEAAKAANRLDQKFHLELYGTYYQDTIDALKPLGYDWQEDCRLIEGEDFQQRLQELHDRLIAGQPVLLGLYDQEIGYVVILVGYDPVKREYTYLQPERIVVSEAMLQEMWRETVTTGTQRCAVYTYPKS